MHSCDIVLMNIFLHCGICPYMNEFGAGMFLKYLKKLTLNPPFTRENQLTLKTLKTNF